MAKRTRPAGLTDGSEAGKEKIGLNVKDTSSRKLYLLPKCKRAEALALKSLKQPIRVSEISKPAKARIIVGVDFGTTFSGVSVVLSSDSDARDVRVITDWVGGARRNEQLEKLPTKIAYAAENEGLDHDVIGYEVEPSHKSYTWFKLLLDTSAVSEFDNPHLQEEMQEREGHGLLRLPPNKTAREVASDYLSILYKHIMDRLEKTQSQEFLKVTPIHFWFTCPATWSDEASHATREASEIAGFSSRSIDQLFMITEPEAAAMSILSESISKGSTIYKTGMTCIIIDLGGGTLDYQCSKLNSLEPLKTEEACEGSGSKSGSTYIDFGLYEYMKTNFGDAFINLSSSKTGAGSRFMDDFQVVKKTFTGRDMNKTFRLALPSLGKALRESGRNPTGYDFEDGEVLLKAVDLEQMFEPVVANAFRLVAEQSYLLKKAKEHPFQVIALCGGLGTSEYVWRRFQTYCEDDLEGKVELVTDERAWSSVVRGAAVRGLEGSVVLSKKAKRAYGIEVHQAFRKGVDDEAASFTDEIGGKRAPGYIRWFSKKGKKFTVGMRETVKVYVALEEDDPDLVYYWNLYSSASDNPPARIEDKGAQKNGRIKIDLGKVFGKSYKRAKTSVDSGRHEDCVYVTLALKLGTEKGTLVVEAFHKRTEVGKTSISYAQDHIRKPHRSGGLV